MRDRRMQDSCSRSHAFFDQQAHTGRIGTRTASLRLHEQSSHLGRLRQPAPLPLCHDVSAARIDLNVAGAGGAGKSKETSEGHSRDFASRTPLRLPG